MWAKLLAKLEPILSWVFIIGIGLWIFYAGAIKPVVNPNPTSEQSGGVSYNYTIKLGMLSCARIPTPQGQISKTVQPIVNKVTPIIKKVIVK